MRTVIGMTGCTQFISLDFSLPLATGAGSASLPLSTPNNPALLGALYYTQYFHIDGGANPLGIVGTNAAEVMAGV